MMKIIAPLIFQSSMMKRPIGTNSLLIAFIVSAIVV